MCIPSPPHRQQLPHPALPTQLNETGHKLLFRDRKLRVGGEGEGLTVGGEERLTVGGEGEGLTVSGEGGGADSG